MGALTTDSKGYRRLSPNIQYKLFPTSVISKEIREGEFTFKIYFRDQYGYNYRAEYVTKHRDQDYFLQGKEVVFRVVAVMGTGQDDMIAPVLEAQATEKKLIRGFATDIDAKDINWRCMELATTLLTAEVANTINKIGEEDLERLFLYADKMEEYLIGKMEQRVGDMTGM